MNLRITPQSQITQQLGYLRSHTDQLISLQQQASTGKRIIRASDDPLDMVALLRAQGDEKRLETSLGNVQTSQRRLDGVNSALLDTDRVLTRARELALSASNGDSDANSRKVDAQEVNRLIEQMFDEGNTQIEGQYVFGGTATNSAPFVATRDGQGQITDVQFAGSDNPVTVPIGLNQFFDTFIGGGQVFKLPAREAFQAMISLRDGLANATNQPEPAVIDAVQQSLASVEQVQGVIRENIGGVSANLEALSNLESRIGDLSAEAKIRSGEIEGADIASVVVELASSQNLFSNTLAISARISQQSLLDYLR